MKNMVRDPGSLTNFPKEQWMAVIQKVVIEKNNFQNVANQNNFEFQTEGKNISREQYNDTGHPDP